MDSERERKEKEEKDEKDEKKEKDEKDDVCPICLKTIDNVDCFVTKCGHKFHGSCMLSWCQIRRDINKEEVCPMCRGQLKNNINFPRVTKTVLHNFLQIMKSHNVSCDSLKDFESEVMWMWLPTGCQQELIETLEYHYFINDEAMYLDTEIVRERTRMPYNFSLSDLNFHI